MGKIIIEVTFEFINLSQLWCPKIFLQIHFFLFFEPLYLNTNRFIIVQCDPSDTCSGHGTCEEDGSCKCSNGFYGDSCSSKSFGLILGWHQEYINVNNVTKVAKVTKMSRAGRGWDGLGWDGIRHTQM